MLPQMGHCEHSTANTTPQGSCRTTAFSLHDKNIAQQLRQVRSGQLSSLGSRLNAPASARCTPAPRHCCLSYVPQAVVHRVAVPSTAHVFTSTPNHHSAVCDPNLSHPHRLPSTWGQGTKGHDAECRLPPSPRALRQILLADNPR